MLIFKLLFLVALSTIATSTPLRVTEPTLLSDTGKLYEITSRKFDGQPIVNTRDLLDQVFELKSGHGDPSLDTMKKYFILKEVSKSDLPQTPAEHESVPSGVFVVPDRQSFDYYQAAALARDRAESQATTQKPLNAKSAELISHVQTLLKQAAQTNKQVVNNLAEKGKLTKEIVQDLVDSYRAAAIEEKASRSSLDYDRDDDELVPPPEEQNGRNYYLDKVSKKTKKYAAVGDAIAKESQLSTVHKENDDEEEEDVGEEGDEGEENDDENGHIRAQITLLPPSEITIDRKTDTSDFKTALKPTDYVSFEGYNFYQPKFVPLPTPKVTNKKTQFASLIKEQPQIFRNHKEEKIVLNQGEEFPKPVDRKSGENEYYDEKDVDDDENENEDDSEEEKVTESPKKKENITKVPSSVKYTNINQNLVQGLSGDTGTRIEFQMHGTNGPKSYKFGYDTGKGKNRQFRLEERDNDGNVRGHYGYLDKRGQLKIVKYVATNDGGFQVVS